MGSRRVGPRRFLYDGREGLRCQDVGECSTVRLLKSIDEGMLEVSLQAFYAKIQYWTSQVKRSEGSGLEAGFRLAATIAAALLMIRICCTIVAAS